MPASYLLMDGNSIGYINQHVGAMSNGEMATHAIYGSLRMIGKLLAAHPGYTPLVVWDGRAQWRYELFPAYKSDRHKSESARRSREEFELQRPVLQKVLANLGVAQLRHPDCEADDVAYVFADHLAKKGRRVRCVSADSDWYAMLRETVDCLDPKSKGRGLVTMQNFSEVTGYHSVRAITEGKAIVGDSSDCLPGADKIGDKTAAELLRDYGSLQSLFEAIDKGRVDMKKVKFKNLAAARGQIELNLRLIDLDAAPVPAGMVLWMKPFNEDMFLSYCRKLRFDSLVRNPGWLVEQFRSSLDCADREELAIHIRNLDGVVCGQPKDKVAAGSRETEQLPVAA